MHTPGPWSAVEEGVYCSAGPVVARVDGRGFEQYAPRDHQERDANARLIAAAPDLLSALKSVVSLSDRKHEAWDAAKAAIKKAEGR